ncbi:PFS and TPR domain-containing protein [Paraphaeosphaeria sporulosa]
MFRWYKSATRCYVYLSDVSLSTATETPERSDWEASFRAKLIAPESVEFFSCEGQRIGDKLSLNQLVHKRTGIPIAALRNCPLDQFSTTERRRWVEGRVTTEEEDIVYCLLGVLNIFMPTDYGEGKERALKRLQAEVDEASNAPSIVPFSQNDRFVGRGPQLAELEAKLFSNEQATSITAIVGPGGTGKSQLALEVAHRTRQNNKRCSVFWMDELLYLPLAVVQAAACINASGMPVQEYRAQLGEHKKSAFEHSSSSQGDDDDKQRVDLARNCAMTLLSDGRYEEAEKLFVQVMEEAEKLDVQVMETSKTKLGADHPSTLTSMANLASTYRNQGRWEEAEKLDVQVMETSKTKLGADHPSTLTSMANLASTYRNQGRWEEAEKLEVQVMETRKTKLGADHPSTLTSMDNLAVTYKHQGRWEEAEKLDVQVMETRKTKLGADHPYTLTSMANLASTYRNQGRWEEAEKLLMQVMETSKTKLGAEHPSTLTSMANLASTYRNQGRWEAAEKLFVQVMETRKTKLGAKHPDTLTSMANLASTYRNQGRWEAAEKLDVQVMEARKTKAEKLEVQVMETSKTKLGAEHPSTLTSMANLASTYRNQGRWEEAEKLEVQVMETSKTKLGADHPETLTSMNNLAFTWKSLGRTVKAICLMQQCVQRYEQVLGASHPHYLSSLLVLEQWEGEQADIECHESNE